MAESNKVDSPRGQKRARKQALLLVREVRRILKRHGHKLANSVAEKIDKSCVDLEKAAKERDHSAVMEHTSALQEHAERHLSFARKSAFREYAESIIMAVFVALFLRAFVVEAFKIPSGSMIPTLHVGDHIFVNKFSFGLRFPFTRWYFVRFSTPKRGDIVVFMYPEEPDKDFIKRVVGVPGDKVYVKNGLLEVFDAEGNRVDIQSNLLTDDFIYKEQLDGSDYQRPVRCSQFEENMEGKTYNVIKRGDGLAFRDFGPEEVHPGQLFVVGDNRDNSHDSRVWGQVPIENVKGKAFVVWWSTRDLGRFGTIIR